MRRGLTRMNGSGKVSEQIDLFDKPDFDGKTYDPALDHSRLTKQLGRVWQDMSRGEWLTLTEIAAWTGDPPASISARLRDLRKPRFGGYTVNKRRRGNPEQGLFEYQMER